MRLSNYNFKAHVEVEWTSLEMATGVFNVQNLTSGHHGSVWGCLVLGGGGLMV